MTVTGHRTNPKTGRLPGRPTKLNDKLITAIAEIVASGVFLETAARTQGLDPSTFRHWKQKGRDDLAAEPPRDTVYSRFVTQIERARAEAEAAAVVQVQLASRTDWRAAAWFLERSFPKQYGQRVAAEIGTAEGTDAVIRVKLRRPSERQEGRRD